MPAPLLPEEVLACILKFHTTPEFSAESHSLHKAVFRAKRNPRYASVLRVFRFSGSPVAPYSRVLESAFFNLQFSNKLRRYNPDMVTYNRTEDFEEFYHRDVEGKLSAEPSLRELVEALAAEVEETLRTEH
jgi:hypothetical protein